jgi:hypothetical protein
VISYLVLVSTTLYVPCIIMSLRLSDSKELSVLSDASQRLIDSDDGTMDAFCHHAVDVSAFEDALQQCSPEHF